jgi:hypothetical protein
MSRIRSIFPRIFTDEAWCAASIPARWFAVGLTTEADDNGVFEWKPVTHKMRIFPADSIDLVPLYAELEHQQIVMRFEADGKTYGALRNFCKYQKPRRPKTWFPLPDNVRNFVAWHLRRAPIEDAENE